MSKLTLNSMNKFELVEKICQQLEHNLKIAQSATQQAISAATDEETVPEHKYDTLALEASYLAHGQAMRVAEYEADLAQYRALIVKEGMDKVALGALVELVDVEDSYRYVYLGPCAGGIKVYHEGVEISVVTPKSPIGAALIGKVLDDEVSYQIGDNVFSYEISAID